MAVNDSEMKMRHLHHGLKIAAEAGVELKPGGYHLR
jgi:copper(I)-binding protein